MMLVEMLTVAFLLANFKQSIPVIQSATDDCNYYVSSMPKLPNFNVSEKCLCKTIDEYAHNITSDLEGRDNVTMIFLQGVQNLTMNLTIGEKLNVTMMGKMVCPAVMYTC